MTRHEHAQLLQVPVMTARYAGKENLAAKMAAAILVHQDHSIARAAGVAAALMLERVILGQSIAVRSASYCCLYMQPWVFCAWNVCCMPAAASHPRPQCSHIPSQSSSGRSTVVVRQARLFTRSSASDLRELAAIGPDPTHATGWPKIT